MSITNIDLKGKTAVVTGASSGIGESLARQLAERGADLVLVARRQDRLETLAGELSRKHPVKARALALDLAAPGAPEALFAQTEGQGQRVDLLMNNAGFGTFGDFLDIPWEQTARQLQLNIVALTELTHRFARAMRARKQGWILNVASIGAYVPSPAYATYCAGKAYVRDFSEALTAELRDHNVQVTCLCPGGTFTEFHQVAGQELTPSFRMTFLSADRCAEIALDALFAGRRNVLSGLSTKATAFFLSLLPRAVTIPIAGAMMGRRKSLPEGGTPTSHG